jgi:hypothetical protein
MWRAQLRWLRYGAVLVIVTTSVFGLNGIVTLQSKASQAEPAQHFLAQLRAVVPTSARVLALPDYWIGLTDNEYRVFYLLFYFSMPVTADEPMALDEALDKIAPDVILLDAPMQRFFADHSTPESDARSNQFWTYMKQHNGRRIRTILDNHGSPIEIYQLTQADQ